MNCMFHSSTPVLVSSLCERAVNHRKQEAVFTTKMPVPKTPSATILQNDPDCPYKPVKPNTGQITSTGPLWPCNSALSYVWGPLEKRGAAVFWQEVLRGQMDVFPYPPLSEVVFFFFIASRSSSRNTVPRWPQRRGRKTSFLHVANNQNQSCGSCCSDSERVSVCVNASASENWYGAFPQYFPEGNSVTKRKTFGFWFCIRACVLHFLSEYKKLRNAFWQSIWAALEKNDYIFSP